MKKIILSSIVALSLASLASCGETKEIIAVSLPNQSTSLNVGIGNKVKDIFEEKGFDVKIQSADDSSTSQKSQIEAFITMGAKMIVLAPVEMGTIEESLTKARAKGIKVVVSGASDISDGCYDAVTVSNEFLVGTNIALLAKKWAESHFSATSDFSTLILKSSLAADPIARSSGMCAITEEYLKDSKGNYIDASGNEVTEDKKIKNPAYCSLVASHPVYSKEMGTNDTGKALVQNALTEHANVRLVLMYGSLFAAGGSQYIVDSYPNDVDDFGIFGGGVSGNEAAYLVGSLPDGVGQNVTVGGNSYPGVKSVFRGAVSFGGEDAAQSIADLSQEVYYGVEGVDYQARTPETLGLWFTVNNDKTEALACRDISNEVVTDFDLSTILTDTSTTIKWQKSK